jgi:peroxiredoxin
MHTRSIVSIIALAAAIASPLALAAARVGDKAPAFTLTDSNGKQRELTEFAGKTVVLEWTNHECPFVQKHYGSANMQGQQKQATGDGVVWLTINSSAPGKQGHVDGAEANRIRASGKAASSAYLLDASGDVGRAYGAKTTPHMYVIDGSGTLQYAGAIDSIPSSDQDDIPKATQYVQVALAELAAGKAVSTPVTQPYGCSVKY